MEIEKLRSLLVTANASGYAGGDSRTWKKESDGSVSIIFAVGDLSYHDNFFGGEPFGGRAVVAHSGKSRWIMVYYGWVSLGTAADAVFKVLKAALLQTPSECPLRGPARFQDAGMTYENEWSGGLARFHGKENISDKTGQIYECRYSGGWIDAGPT